MYFPEPIDNIAPAHFEAWLTRQGWALSETERYVWEKLGRTDSEPWQVLVVDISEPNRQQRNREAIETLAHIYCCRQWEIEAAIKIEPIVFSPSGQPAAHGTIEIFDQVERLDVGGGAIVELTDHNPAKIKADNDGLHLLIGLAVSAKYGWGNTRESIGRGGGSFALTVEKI